MIRNGNSISRRDRGHHWKQLEQHLQNTAGTMQYLFLINNPFKNILAMKVQYWLTINFTNLLRVWNVLIKIQYHICIYKINLHSLLNRPEKLIKDLLFYLFLTLVQMNFTFSDNVTISYFYQKISHTNKLVKNLRFKGIIK